MLNGWTILNVRRRLDRRIAAVAQARMLHIPPAETHIWEAKDHVEMNIKDVPTLLDAIADDGFPDLHDETRYDPKHLGRICQLWNICRFLRHLIEINETHMFIHDGVLLTRENNFIPMYQWWKDIVHYLEKAGNLNGYKFLFLTNGHPTSQYPLSSKPIVVGSIISHGIRNFNNFARIYSPAGAEFVLQRILKTRIDYADHILMPQKGEEDFLDTKGTFSVTDLFFKDAPNEWLGSNTVDHLVSYSDEYARLFPPDIIPEAWKTGDRD